MHLLPQLAHEAACFLRFGSGSSFRSDDSSLQLLHLGSQRGCIAARAVQVTLQLRSRGLHAADLRCLRGVVAGEALRLFARALQPLRQQRNLVHQLLHTACACSAQPLQLCHRG